MPTFEQLPDHPDIQKMERDGFTENPHWGSDYFGDEILVGDPIAEIDNEIVLVENIDRYLEEVLGVVFKDAE